jgi:NAD(P)-dependent dehydrogenase (short-subunit alcohol dehydrogenase family)/aryl carrier-like protein
VIEDVTFLKALRLSDQDSVELHFVFTLAQEGGYLFQAVSVRGDEERLHVKGRFRAMQSSESRLASSNLARVESEGSRTLSGPDLYSRFASAGYGIGPSFSWNSMVWSSESGSVAEMRAASPVERAQVVRCHPGFIDSCFQAATVTLLGSVGFGSDGLFVPLSIDRVRFFGSDLLSGGRCAVTAREVSSEGFSASLNVVGLDAVPRLSMDGLEVRAAQSHLFGKTPGAIATRIPAWRAAEGRKDAEKSPGRWLVPGDYAPYAEEIVKALRQRGHSVEVISSSDELQSILSDSGENRESVGVLFAVSVNEIGPLSMLCRSMFDCLAEIARQGVTDEVSVVVTCLHHQSGVKSEVQSHPGAGVFEGLFKAWKKECPESNARLILVDSLGDDGITRDALIEEILCGIEDQILVQDASRFVPEWRELGSQTSSLPIREGSTYLITGGLGALGQHTAAWLLTHGAGRVILLSRSSDLSRLAGNLREFAGNAGRLTLVEGDVTNLNDVRRVIEDIRKSGYPLAGILHAAGILRDGTFARQSGNVFEEGLSAKVQGALNLNTAVGEDPLDFFACFSSISAAFGAAGQASYCAANCFLDTFARQRNSSGKKTVSVQWGPWAGDGMAKHLTQVAKRKQGEEILSRLSALDALMAMGEVLAGTDPVVLIAPSVFYASMAQSNVLSSAPNTPSPSHKVSELVSSILGVGVNQLARKANLMTLGFDSLMAVELRRGVNKSFGVALDLSAILKEPTVEGIEGLISSSQMKASVVRAKSSASTKMPVDDLSSALAVLGELSDEQAEGLLIELRSAVSKVSE